MEDRRAILLPRHYYHVFNEAVGNEKLFVRAGNYHYFLSLFEKYIEPLADLYSYCLLPRQFHFLIRIKEPETLTTFMEKAGDLPAAAKMFPVFLLQRFSNFFNAYTKAFNKQQLRKGKLFLEPFNRLLVDFPEALQHLVLYIHANPVQYGYCKRPEDWWCSSYHPLRLGSDPSLKGRR